jgi:hypothetical protein
MTAKCPNCNRNIRSHDEHLVGKANGQKVYSCNTIDTIQEDD